MMENSSNKTFQQTLHICLVKKINSRLRDTPKELCHLLVAVSVLVNIATLGHHGLFVQSKRQLQLKQNIKGIKRN